VIVMQYSLSLSSSFHTSDFFTTAYHSRFIFSHITPVESGRIFLKQ